MKQHTVLVVDDEPDMVRSVKDLLRLDYRVIGATGAEAGIRALAVEEVHVIITDQRMPDMTGVEFLRGVRHQYPEAIRLLFTGYADIRAVIDAINQGHVYRYITKPCDPDELLAIMREACERHDLILQRRRLIDELQASNAELVRRNEDLRRASQLKSDFIQVASHELLTPLGLLQGLVWLAERATDAGTVPGDLVRRISRAGGRLQRIVEELTEMLRAGQLRPTLPVAPVELQALLRAAADDVSPMVALRRQELVLELPEGPARAPLNAERMRDVLDHVLTNAIKFTPDAGRISLGARLDPAGAEIWVRDTGQGMDEETRRHVFDPFFTGFDTSHHSSGQFEYNSRGLGLGLSVVKAFVEMHGGTVAVESAPGEGSTFTVRLPVAPPGA